MIDTLTLILLEAAEAVCNLLKKEEVTNGRGELLSYTFSLLFTVGSGSLLKYNAFPSRHQISCYPHARPHDLGTWDGSPRPVLAWPAHLEHSPGGHMPARGQSILLLLSITNSW